MAHTRRVRAIHRLQERCDRCARRPQNPFSTGAMIPAANTPNAKQATMNAIREERRRAGAYSDIKAVAIGTAPPRPRLVITRQAINTVGFDARVTPRVVSPMTIIIAISVGRRP